MSIAEEPEIRRAVPGSICGGFRPMRALLFACALFCLLTVIGMPAAAFQRLGILPPGEDDCLMGSIVIELGSNLSADFPSKEEIRKAENMVRAELGREGIGDFNYCMKVSRTAAGKMIIMHVRPLSESTPEEGLPERRGHIFYIQNGVLQRIEKKP
ncbi:hypothetical protein [uncultured Desulfovibrio sp.]|uniref:hypothetical protein n=1 Tax=uncultured Desulfovibrio sp. TaxID=167968 RepID=UPI0026DC0C96|nr:hypothetical protein [uncultured Desulfovibrio sp.]